LLFPFWSPLLKKSTPFIGSIWEHYNFDASYYTLVENAADADALFLPYNYWQLRQQNPELLAKILHEAEGFAKPLLIDAHGDSDEHIPVEHSIVLRTSQYRFKTPPREIIVPAYVDDLWEWALPEEERKFREKGPLPVVGFTGWASVSRNAWLKAIFFRTRSLLSPRYAAYTPGVAIRKRVLKTLQTSPGVSANFIIRNSFSGNVKTMQGSPDELRAQFVANMRDSDYALAVKGNGNYSMRFYEALSMGRIPLLVDTESLLPLESRIDYHECCLIVRQHEIRRMGDIVAQFHRDLSQEQFLRMQQRAREVFVTYLRVDGFSKYLMQEIQELL
jgi:hypothetical protein